MLTVQLRSLSSAFSCLFHNVALCGSFLSLVHGTSHFSSGFLTCVNDTCAPAGLKTFAGAMYVSENAGRVQEEGT
jgi:hypothetical protein